MGPIEGRLHPGIVTTTVDFLFNWAVSVTGVLFSWMLYHLFPWP